MFFIAVRCAAFQVCDQSSAGKAPMCFPFLSLCSASPAPKPLCCTPVFPLREQSWAGGWEGQRQEGWPEGYSILPFIGLGSSAGGAGGAGGAVAGSHRSEAERASVCWWEVLSNCLCMTCGILLSFFPSTFPSPLPPLNCLFS